MKKLKDLNIIEKKYLAKKYIESFCELEDNKSSKKNFLVLAGVFTAVAIGLLYLVLNAISANVAVLLPVGTAYLTILNSISFIRHSKDIHEVKKDILNGKISTKEFNKLLKDNEFQEILANYLKGKSIYQVSHDFQLKNNSIMDETDYSDKSKYQNQNNTPQQYKVQSLKQPHNTSKNQEQEREF